MLQLHELILMRVKFVCLGIKILVHTPWKVAFQTELCIKYKFKILILTSYFIYFFMVYCLLFMQLCCQQLRLKSVT